MEQDARGEEVYMRGLGINKESLKNIERKSKAKSVHETPRGGKRKRKVKNIGTA